MLDETDRDRGLVRSHLSPLTSLQTPLDDIWIFPDKKEFVTEDCLEKGSLVTSRGQDVVNITSSLAADKQIKLLYELPPDLHCQRLGLNSQGTATPFAFLRGRQSVEGHRWDSRGSIKSECDMSRSFTLRDGNTTWGPRATGQDGGTAPCVVSWRLSFLK